MSISINGGHGFGATQPIKTRKEVPSLPMNRHFTVHDLGGGRILATRMGARKPSWACIDQDLRELGFNMRDTNLGFSLASTASYGGRSCYGYMWSSRPGQHPIAVTRLSNVPPDPTGRCVRDLTHVESDDRVLRDLRCFFSPRRIFTARDAWGHLHGASVRIWGSSSCMEGDDYTQDCTREAYDMGGLGAYAERYVFVEVVLQELWTSAASPGADDVFVGFDPFVDDWAAIRDYCDDLRL